jgi:SAM-dependent methyltransferase
VTVALPQPGSWPAEPSGPGACTSSTTSEKTALRYGIDGWPYLLALTATALAAAVVGFRRRPAFAVAALAAAPAASGWWYAVRGKLGLRDAILDAVAWRGDEDVVDLGAGAGLLAIRAAHRTCGRVVACDLFVAKDLLCNGEARLRRNAARSGVRLDVVRADVRSLPLPDASADVVLSALCLHNVPNAEGRRTALREVVRVLRPGGTLVLSDLAHVDDEYAPQLHRAGLHVETRGRVRGTFPPQRLVIAQPPLTGAFSCTTKGS